jgi:hypothetical protein
MIFLVASWVARACALALAWLWLQTTRGSGAHEHADRHTRAGLSWLLAVCVACLALHFLAGDVDAGFGY